VSIITRVEAPANVHLVTVFPHRGRWKADLAGALAILFAIAFGTGIADDDIRGQLASWV
jgi:hypothetical protein